MEFKCVGGICLRCMIGYLHTPPEFTPLYSFGDEKDLIKYKKSAVVFKYCPFCGKSIDN